MRRETNNLVIIGNIVEISEGKTSKGTEVANMTVANHRGENTNFIDVSAFGGLAEVCNEYLSTGRKVAVTGMIRTDKNEKNGKTYYNTWVRADNIEFLDYDEDKSGSGKSKSKPSKSRSKSKSKSKSSKGEFSDSKIPF